MLYLPAKLLLLIFVYGEAFTLRNVVRMSNTQSFYPFKPNDNENSRVSMRRYAKGSSSKGPESSNKAARQLLGIKGASETKNKWAIRLQLCKPVTWIPLIWGVACGAAASGNYHTWNPFSTSDVPATLYALDAAKAATCMFLSGPLLTGYTQTLNDWEDRAIDAINEPYRPIPSGAISEGEVIAQIWTLLLSGIALAFGLDQWAGHADPIITKLTIFGCFISYIYSAPPLKLKAVGWAGSFALGMGTHIYVYIYIKYKLFILTIL